MSQTRIWTVSTKGGVGKSTVCANLARAYAAMGLRVLVVDLDAVAPSLDMLLGAENLSVYDISDALSGRVSPAVAATRLPSQENMFLMCGSTSTPEAFSAVALETALSRAEKELGISLTFIDSHALDNTAGAIASCVTDTLVVSDTTAPSLRAAESCGVRLRRLEAPRMRMILNRAVLDEKDPHPFVTMIDQAGIQLVGIVPFDPAVVNAQEQGIMAKDCAGHNTVAAFRNIALRLKRKNVPLFSSYKGINRRRLLGV